MKAVITLLASDWDCFIVLRNASRADPVLGWKGGMRPVIKCSTPGEEFKNLGLGIRM
jgi:hypothetical protein